MSHQQAAYGDQAQMGHNNPPSEMEILEQRLEAYPDEAAELERLLKKSPPEKIEDGADAVAAEITVFLKAVKTLGSRFEEIHKTEKKPFLECGKRVDAWKNEQLERLAAITAKFAPLVLDFNQRKDEAERQRQLAQAKKDAEAAEKLRAESAAHQDAGIIDTATDLLQAAHDKEAKAETLTMNAVGAKPGAFGKISGGGATASIKAPWTGEIEDVGALDLEKLRHFFSEDSLQKAINAFVRDGGRQLNGVKIYQKQQLNIR